MSDPEGLREIVRRSHERARLANLEDIRGRLEGPGSEERMLALQSRFRGASAGARGALSGRRLALLCAVVFLAVVVIGLALTVAPIP